MSERCSLCGHELGDVTFYVRWFENGHFAQCLTKQITPSLRRFPRGTVLVNGKQRSGVDIVNMATGDIARNDFKTPLPVWLREPMVRASVLATGELPLLYKKSRVEKASRTPPIP